MRQVISEYARTIERSALGRPRARAYITAGKRLQQDLQTRRVAIFLHAYEK